MMVRAIESSKDFGEGGHKYNNPNSFHYVSKWISNNAKRNPKSLKKKLKDAPDEFVYVTSIPLGGPGNKRYINIAGVIQVIKDAGYKIYPIVFHRKPDFNMKSMVKAGHEKNHEQARQVLFKAYEHIFHQLAKVKIQPIIIKYEWFVKDENYREWIFKDLLELPMPRMEFFNANDKYK